MRLFLVALLAAAVLAPAHAADTPARTIQVTGSSSMTVTPDILPLHIAIREYYEEEFNSNATVADYKTLVSLETIERNVLQKLRALGIPDSAINVSQTGTTWRPTWEDPERRVARPVLLRKELVVTVHNTATVDKVLRSLDLRGVEHIALGELRSSKEQEYRRQVKIAALKAAREKAQYLAESMGIQIGQVLTIREISETAPPWFPRTTMASNTVMETTQGTTIEAQKVTLRYEMEAIFELR